MNEDEHYQLHLMMLLENERQVLSITKIPFDEIFHSNVEER
jgi:hypothetical protein